MPFHARHGLQTECFFNVAIGGGLVAAGEFGLVAIGEGQSSNNVLGEALK